MNCKGSKGLHPPILRITIRHTDWWYFLLGQNSPLALDPKKSGRATPRTWIADDQPFENASWGSRFAILKGLKQFELELETTTQKRTELDEVVERAKSWRFELGDEGVKQVLVLDKTATERKEWTGSKHFKGIGGAADTTPGLHLLQGRGLSAASMSRANTMASRSGSTSEPTREESIAAASEKLQLLNQRLRKGSKVFEDTNLAPEDQLDYYVVTLYWRAQAAPELQPNVAEEGETDTSVSEPEDVATASAAAPVAAPTAPPQGIFAHTVARGLRGDAFPTAYG